jgi:mannitol-1-phosphate 5-dehydrogenase
MVQERVHRSSSSQAITEDNWQMNPNLPVCVVVGTGRSAGGFLVPLLRSAGWQVALVGRNPAIIDSIAGFGGIWLHSGPDVNQAIWFDGVTALSWDDPSLPALINTADLLATSVGPSALGVVGRRLAPFLRARLDTERKMVNLITFENHRRGPELLAVGLLEADASLAAEIGVRLGIGGGVLWRAISRRELTPRGICYQADDVMECYVDAASLLASLPPLDGSLPGLELVRSFDHRMVEKLWLFNAGHAAAAYFSWHAGYSMLDEGMRDPAISALVESVVEEACVGFKAHVSTHAGSDAIKPRSIDWLLQRYANAELADPVTRVGREPRRKLGPMDRFIGPSIACLSVGVQPGRLALACASALAYAEPADSQAIDLQRELELIGPEEVLAMVSMLDPQEELARLISNQYRSMIAAEQSVLDSHRLLASQSAL